VTLADGGSRKPGDPLYSAPGIVDARGDLYAAGAVLFEMLSGKPPFFADDAEALRRLHAYAPRQTLKQRAPDRAFPEEVETVIATAIAKARDARFRDAATMLAGIDRALDAVEASTPPPAPATPATPPPALDESLVRLAADLMPAQSDERASAPVVPVNVSREVPKLSLPSRIQQALRRTSRARLIAAAVAVVVVLAIVIATCGDSTPAHPKTTKVATPAVIDLDKRCEALAKACGDTPKHVAKIVEGCKATAAKQHERTCAEKADAAYACFETKLCAAEKIWAFDDLRVLSERHHTCVAEGSAARASCK
jgi:hypothetical protein